MALCLALAAPPAGSRHRPDSGAGKLHAELCHHVGPAVPGWLPSAPVLELYLAGPDEQQDEVLSVDREGHMVTGPLQWAPTSEHMFGDRVQPSLSPGIFSESICKSQRWIFHDMTPKPLPQMLGTPILVAG